MTAIVARTGVDDFEYSEADSFLTALGARHAQWTGDTWVYRGQADANWQLRATAVRSEQAFTRFGLAWPTQQLDPAPASWSIRDVLQKEMLRQFRAGLERTGVAIPTRSPRIDDREGPSIFSSAEPHNEAFPLMALAQHHGLPTLLLDWTTRAWVAAYFAAASALEDQHGSRGATHLAVWAIQRHSMCDDRRRSLFYEAPGGTNPNLRAQSGLFTFFMTEDEPSLEEHLCRLRTQAQESWKLRRMILPIDEAPTLLDLLASEGITGESMFPGADGVVRALRETAWRKGFTNRSKK